MSVRLIHAINKHSVNKGISGFCKKQIAQGYGISYELLKKFYKDTFDCLREKAEQVYSKYTENKSKAKFSYTCVTPKCSLFLCFSEMEHTEKSPDFYLCAAFDKNEIDVVNSWVHGNFCPALPPNLTDRHLDFLASHYARVTFPDIDHSFAFRMVQLAIAYGKFMKSHRYATEDPEITNNLTTCLHVLSAGDMDFHKFERLITSIAGWSFGVRKQRIFRAARRVLSVLDTYFMFSFSASLRARVQSSAQLPTEEDLDQASRIANLIRRSLLASAQWQAESHEAPEECYGTNSELAILRLLYINSAVSYDPQGDTYMGTPLYGEPVSKLEPLLKNGLLDDRGHSQPNFIHDIPLQ